MDVLEFSILSPEEIKRLSVGFCNTSTPNDNLNRTSVELNSLKLGSHIDPQSGSNGRDTRFKACETCFSSPNGSSVECPGHFAYIDLECPVYHCLFMEQTSLLLRAFCHNPKCYRLRFNPLDHIDSSTQQVSASAHKVVRRLLTTGYGRFTLKKLVQHVSTKTKCPHCMFTVPKVRVTKDQIWTSMSNKANSKKSEMSPKETYHMFERLNQDDVTFLQLAYKPTSLLITRLPVPPPAIRPTLYFGSNKFGQDDLTRKLQDIIRRNEKVCKDRIPENEKALQMDVTMFIDASKVNPAVLNSNKNRNNKKDFKSLIARLQTKSGRVRNNLMGKRVDFTARAVVTGDPNIAVDEFGIPQQIAMKLTVPDRVTCENIHELQALVNKGPFSYPGANNLIRCKDDKELRTITLGIGQAKHHPVLNIGDIVERHLRRNDIVMINRQPSLHKESMMAVKLVILPGKTFRLNLSVAALFNADFDGDEMNIHAPQTLLARTELKLLAGVKEQFMSAQYNRPGINVVQDTLNALYLLTTLQHNFNVGQVMQFMMACDEISEIENAKNGVEAYQPWSGARVVSLLFPKTYDFDCSSITIKNGQIIKGYICKKNMGSVEDGLLAHYWRRYGNQACIDLITKAQKLATCYMEYHSHTVGYSDLNLRDQDAIKQIDLLINEHKHMTVQIDSTKPRITSPEDRYNLPFLQSLTTKLGDMVQNDIGKSNRLNNITIMAASGSKGNSVNARQLCAALGQQVVNGARPLPCIRNRALPHFHANDVRPAARGFIFNNFKKGLNCIEYFFHAQGGREGLTDTSIKTASVGYTQRRVMKAVEDISVRYDGTVRNAQDHIIQFRYGDDGKDASYLCNNILTLWSYNNDQIKAISYDTTEYNLLLENKTLIQIWNPQRSSIDPILLPLPLSDMIHRGREDFCKRQSPSLLLYSSNNTQNGALTHLHFSNMTEEINKSIYYLFRTHPLFVACLRLTLHFKAVCESFQIQSTQCLRHILKYLHSELQKADVQAGEAVGALAAQSVGEPLTQMTLNCVHGDTQLLLNVNDKLERITIGNFVDQQMQGENNQYEQSNRVEYKSIKEDTQIIKVLSCTENGKVEWKRVEGVSRHPVINSDGSDVVLKFYTLTRRKIIVTKGESLLTLSSCGKKILPCVAADLKIGDHLPISTTNGLEMNKMTDIIYDDSKIELEYSMGMLCGLYLAEGSIDLKTNIITISGNQSFVHSQIETHLQSVVPPSHMYLNTFITSSTGKDGIVTTLITSQMLCWFFCKFLHSDMADDRGSRTVKRIDPALWTANESFLAGTIYGFIMGGRKMSMVSTSHGLLQDFQQIFLHFKDSKTCIKRNTLISLKKGKGRLSEHEKDKEDKEDKEDTEDKEEDTSIIWDIFMDPITKIEEVSMQGGKVYDLTVAETRNFNTLDGICVRDTFHFSGAGNDAVFQGIPMFQALLDKPHDANRPFMRVALNHSLQHNFEKVEQLAHKLPCRTLKDITDEVSVHYQPNLYTSVNEVDAQWLNVASLFSSSDILERSNRFSAWTFRLQISAVRLLHMDISTTEIARILQEQLGKTLHFLVSPILPIGDLFASIIYMKGMDCSIDQLYWQQHGTSLLQSIIISGIKGIQNAKVVTLTDNSGYMIQTEGINMTQVGLMPGVDWYRTTCSRVRETEAYLGLLAARQLLFETFNNVFKNSGTYVSPRHLKLICDRMTQSGNVSRVHRDGTNAESGRGVLDRASYEKTGRELADAALYGERDLLRGVSSQLCVGKPIQVGTHTSFDIIMDTKALGQVACPALHVDEMEQTWKREQSEIYIPDIF